MYYDIEVAGLNRRLPLCPIDEGFNIAGFVMYGDVEMTVACARALLEIAPEYDILLTCESKGIPLAYEMARQHNDGNYIIARKSVKLYMQDVLCSELRSITTDQVQKLYLSGQDAAALCGRRVLIVDDVISTGESLRAAAKLTQEAGGIIVGCMAVLAEGDAALRKDIFFLNSLPLFDANGQPLPDRHNDRGNSSEAGI